MGLHCFNYLCHNLNIGFVIKCENARAHEVESALKSHWALSLALSPICDSVFHTLLHLCESCECSEPWLKRQTNTIINNEFKS
jgi:hypothetical protein